MMGLGSVVAPATAQVRRRSEVLMRRVAVVSRQQAALSSRTKVAARMKAVASPLRTPAAATATTSSGTSILHKTCCLGASPMHKSVVCWTRPLITARRWLSATGEGNGTSKGSEADSKPASGESQGQALNADNPLRGAYAIVFTCNKCGNRSSKSFSKQAYHEGVVIVNCESCNAKHLIADNLDWFKGIGGGKNVEEMLQTKGDNVRKQEHEGVLEVTAEDLQLALDAKKQAQDKTPGRSNE